MIFLNSTGAAGGVGSQRILEACHDPLFREQRRVPRGSRDPIERLGAGLLVHQRHDAVLEGFQVELRMLAG